MENENIKHTLYEWCFLNNIRPTSSDFDKDDFIQDDFMTRKIDIEEFKEFMQLGKFKSNSMPRKPEKYLELRMYGLVPYNISEIQKGIQFGHSVARYGREFGNQIDGASECEYIRWVDNWETFIILNGGTSNEGNLVFQGYTKTDYYGTMQQHLTDLKTAGIRVSSFYEPDLNSMLSAITFLVDERVFNKKLYPDFVALPFPDVNPSHDAYVSLVNKWSKDKDTQYANWVDKIGGPKNEFLRMFLADKRLA